ncbi:MAG TPA: Rne/Rng family ribonuclease, partial [Tianweitania sediminis]|nr:Rne/Rng family ribonuclease [Tianweitania sediminis]
SRKITNIQDRKRLKDVMKELEVPQGMGVILRTAGESRTKAEIKRDYEYLMRLWENVRTLTLQSTAPALVYEEGSLIKRSVRDLYNKEIDEIQVAGEEGYREAKDFMRMLMPSHAKMVQPYRDTVPIFARNGIEAQLDRMLQPQVNLKSGGYIIINQTEALVAIDVNSGRSTKEHSIEDTALQTNLEAADEVARQLRLRDLAGLIVVDFIDMEENRNNRAVEKRMKDALKNDRARIQVGRISHFGLLEMSRQRIRASVLESTTQTCPHCGGTGHIRSDSSVALHVIRAIEEYLLKDNRSHIVVRTPVTTALYVLNHKRSTLVELERRFGLSISMEADETLGSQHYAITKGAPVENPVVIAPPSFETVIEEEDDDAQMEPFDSSEVDADEDASESEARDNQNGKGEQGERDNDRKRRRRRRRRGGRERDNAQPQADAFNQDDEATAGDDDVDADADGETVSTSSDVSAADADQDHKKRRRGKRGGRRNRREDGEGLATVGDDQEEDQGSAEASVERDADVVAAEAAAGIDPEGERPEGEPEAVATAEPAAPAAAEAEAPAAEAEAAPVKAPRARARRPRKTAASAAAVEEATADAAPAEEASSEQPTASSAEPEAPQQTSVTDAQPDGNAAAEAPVAHEADGADRDNSDSAEEAAPASRRRAGASDTPSEPVVTSNVTEPEKPRKGGWWQRKSFF